MHFARHLVSVTFSFKEWAKGKATTANTSQQQLL
jgi:hypothetical protein